MGGHANVMATDLERQIERLADGQNTLLPLTADIVRGQLAQGRTLEAHGKTLGGLETRVAGRTTGTDGIEKAVIDIEGQAADHESATDKRFRRLERLRRSVGGRKVPGEGGPR